MKKITILMIMITAFSSCSNMESDAEKVCDLTTQTMEMMPKTIDLSMKAGFGDEESKKEAQKQLDKLEADIKKTGTEIDNIKSKYDEDEFQAYLLENCEAVKGMTKMGEALQGLENSIENN